MRIMTAYLFGVISALVAVFLGRYLAEMDIEEGYDVRKKTND